MGRTLKECYEIMHPEHLRPYTAQERENMNRVMHALGFVPVEKEPGKIIYKQA